MGEMELESIIEIKVSNKLKELGAFLYYGLVEINKVYCEKSEELSSFIKNIIDEIRSRFKVPEALKNIEEVKAYRKFLWRLKIDPTKVRPSSEALLRRVLRGKEFPRINDIVDIGNIVSMVTLVRIGLYDFEKLTPPLMLRLSYSGELFKGIGGKEEVLREGIPILVDSKGQVIHLYPHRDSILTAVTPSIKKLLIVSAGVEGVKEELVKKSVKLVSDYLLKFGCATSYQGPWRSR